MQKKEYFFTIKDENSLKDHIFPLIPGDRIFFFGDLGSGKTTYIRELLHAHFADRDLIVQSPTYTYYTEYNDPDHIIPSVVHFDLYRLEKGEDFLLIGGTDILDDPTSIALVEWPEILGDSVEPTRTIMITRTSETSREITMTIFRDFHSNI